MSHPSPTAPQGVRSLIGGFAPFIVITLVHVATLIWGPVSWQYPTKLLLMPALAAGVIWALRDRWTRARGYATLRGGNAAIFILLLAIVLSWLGDGAAFFFPLPGAELPFMLLCFGLAHIAYIVVLIRWAARRSFPRAGWLLVLWWVGMLIVLWPHLGALIAAVAIYGVVLGGTAAAALRGNAATTVGGLLFLASDTILALRLFLPDVPLWASSPAVMITYTLGQGLLAWGICHRLREGAPA